jgi:outer membrane lipoprotein LolB
MTTAKSAAAPIAAIWPSAGFKAAWGWRAGYGLAWLVLILLMSGCATPRPPSFDSAAENAAFWSGRMAIQVIKEPPESMSASFELQGSAQRGDMLLLSPIGTTLARLSWTPDVAQLTQGEKTLESPNLQSLATRLTGTELPIAALFDWLAGRTAEVPGWQVDLSQHAQGRLSAERLSPAPRTVLRIVLNR